ncbi:MAG: hypothetical protein WC356_04885 [Candidatus Micrarchaeia archaeon]
MSKRKVTELWTDPASGQLSASRLCLCVLILVYLPALVALEALGVKLGIWSHIVTLTGTMAGIYGINSGVRVWRGRVLPPER